MQEVINQMLKSVRGKEVASSEQLTLGELISLLEPIASNQESHIKKYEEEQRVQFDFAGTYPIGIDSYRGYYDELALSYKAAEYYSINSEDNDMLEIGKFLKLLKDSIGKSFYGWKGGDYMMDKNTPLWVDNEGQASGTFITGLRDCYLITLTTASRDD